MRYVTMHEVYPNVWITDISTAQTCPKDRFDRIITVCQDSIEDNVPDSIPYEWYNMSDGMSEYGGDDSMALFQRATFTIIYALIVEETILVHCHAGQSRSVTTVAAAIALYDDRDVNDVISDIKDIRDVEPNEEMVKKAQRLVENINDN